MTSSSVPWGSMNRKASVINDQTMTFLSVDLFFIMLKGVINVYNVCGPDACSTGYTTVQSVTNCFPEAQAFFPTT